MADALLSLAKLIKRIDQSLIDLAAQKQQLGEESMMISLSLRQWLINPWKDTASELWNPTAAAQISSQSATPSTYSRRHVDAAKNIHDQLDAVRTPAFASHILAFMRSIGQSPISPRSSALTVLMSSFTHTPFDKLSFGDDEQGKPLLVQYQLSYVPSIPIPWKASPITIICRKGVTGGYWVEGNLNRELWDHLLNSEILKH